MTSLRQRKIQLFQENNKDKARLLISCPDQPGIVAAVSKFLFDHGANILQSDQYSIDPEGGGRFFMRVEFILPNLSEREKHLEEEFSIIGENFKMDWHFAYAYHIKRMAIFVSKQDHCLMELLWQWQAGDLVADIPVVISNHPDLGPTVEQLGIPFYHIPVTKETKQEAEQKQLKLLEEYKIDVSVLARYMQILSPEFIAAQPLKIINIHHSFLPAFIGARPYERAYERGVKIIGATSHYVTDDLDEGPIIEQGVQRVNHSNNAEDLKRIGRSVERSVLARAVTWHLEDRVIAFKNKTVVFG
ncbi:formyltetrahydrofolate deformylase [Schinkia azotoformans]|uniref:Formyltetrahydrofolate deformylase n=1 Tax=Schinkia azotoformans LMG 9581 TaxID=1131731 RepID=K6D177_SCHAZ|nr:formyltetrahydrofolate deformylase [Schinkia azotoformans]EKN66242.1 formyltetrahydrofolate deformylase [Schinkia azotoformans LMG 9581]MEC1639998.1 formyltetrahydrofolate deformylase [Schinkia azotoformans]MEC1947524.1 formyltetrahydrofolate deformylase [Schinkia azotoformans]